jgi:hypothetical protein
MTRPAVVFLIAMMLLLAACAPAVQEVMVEKEMRAEELPDEAIQAPEGEDGMAVGEPGEMTAPQAANDKLLIAFQSGPERMVIKDAQIDLLVSDTDRAVAQATKLAAEQGGYIIDAQAWFDGGYKYAELKLGVPVATFEHTLNVLRDLGLEVTNESVSGQDVSAQYNDLNSKLTNLEATAERVRGFLEDAKTIEEALTINQTLAGLEAQIEEVKGQMRYYEGRSAFSTVTVRMNPQIIAPTPTPTPTPVPPPAWDPGKTFRQASAITVKNMQHFVDSAIWFVVIYWPLIVLAILGVLVVRYLRRKAKSLATPEVLSRVEEAGVISEEVAVEGVEE